MTFKNFTLFALTLFLAACVSVQDYPLAWGKPFLGEGGACPQVDGVFQNQGHGSDPRYPPNLAWQLFVHSSPWRSADRVQIQLTDSNIVSIRTLSGNSVLYQHDLVRGKNTFSCEGGFLAIPKGQFINRDGVLASENATVYLAPSDGGSLVVKERTTAVGLMFLVPVAGSSTTWSRYLSSK